MSAPPRRAILLTVALALGLPLLFMGPTLVGGRPLIRDDASLQFYPQFAAYARCLKAHDLYLWDPDQFCGLPALATAQSGGLYPPHLLAFRLLPWQLAIHLCYWLHLSLALLAFVWVARHLGIAWRYALVGAIVYTFSGFQAAHVVHYSFITACAHLPLMLAVLQTALRRGRWAWWGLLGLEWALAFMSSQPQLFLMALCVSLIWLLAGGWWRDSTAESAAQAWRRAGLGLAAAGVVGFLLCAPHLLPELELARLAQTGAAEEAGASFARSYPFRTVDLPRLLYPNLYGTIKDSVTGGGPVFHETSGFFGAGVLVLAAAGLVMTRRRGYAFAVAVLVVGALLIPASSPIHALAAKLPLVGGFRAMGRWIILPIFSAALLGALALTAFGEGATDRERPARKAAWLAGALALVPLLLIWATFGMEGGARAIPGSGATVPRVNLSTVIYNWLVGWEPLLVVAGVGLALAALHVRRSRAVVLALALLATGLPLWHYWQTVYEPGPRDFYVSAPRTMAAIQRLGPGRITTLPPALVNRDDSWRTRSLTLDDTALLKESLSPVVGLPFGVAYGDGYHHRLTTPVTYRLWQQYFRYGTQAFTGEINTTAETVATYGTAAQRMERLHRLSGIQYVVTPGVIADPMLPLVHEGPVRVYSYQRPHPQAWLTGRAIVVPDPEQQLEMVKRRSFDPERETVVGAEVPGLAGPGVTGSAVVSRRNNEARVVVTASGAALLVLADAWYPGWRASVDGQPAPLRRANFGFRAVPVPAGQHEVAFRYQPRSWTMALALAGVGLVLLMALLLTTSRPPRGREPV